MRIYLEFKSTFTAKNGIPSGASDMMFWRLFVESAKDHYRRLHSAQRLDDADWFIEKALQDDWVPMQRREVLWKYAERLSGAPVVWENAPSRTERS